LIYKQTKPTLERSGIKIQILITKKRQDAGSYIRLGVMRTARFNSDSLAVFSLQSLLYIKLMRLFEDIIYKLLAGLGTKGGGDK